MSLTEQAHRIAGHIQQPMSADELAAYVATDNYSSQLALQHALLLLADAKYSNYARVKKKLAELMPNITATINEAQLAECMRKGEQAWKDVPDATAWVEELRGGSEYPAALVGLPDEKHPLRQALDDGQEIKMHRFWSPSNDSHEYLVRIYGDCYIEVENQSLTQSIKIATENYETWKDSDDE